MRKVASAGCSDALDAGSKIKRMKVAVLGAGSWGTALSVLLARNGHDVALVGRDEDEIGSIRAHRENSRYLPGFAIPDSVQVRLFSDDLGPHDLWVVAVPSGAVRQVAHVVRQPDALVVVASKGLEPGTSSLLSDVVSQALPTAKVGALSGPNLAVELVRGIPTVAVAACADDVAAEFFARAFNCPSYRVYLSDDLPGVELAGALKNVLAISAGMSDGLGYGDNTKGALVARGLYEMTKLGVAMGARMDTFFGIAGVGDLFATANSKLSRNYRVGRALGEGRELQQALDEIGQVAEGVTTASAAAMLARRCGVQTPIMEATEAVLRGRLRPKDGVAMLMERMPKREGFLAIPN